MKIIIICPLVYILRVTELLVYGESVNKKINYKICFPRGRLKNGYIIIGWLDESRSVAVEVKIKIHNSAKT